MANERESKHLYPGLVHPQTQKQDAAATLLIKSE
jgi:hypothetical protein